jgi:type IV pilus assembly protein PilY1
MQRVKSAALFIVCLSILLFATSASAVAPKPNVLILFSNDWTAATQGHIDSSYDNSLDYYGYFDQIKEYEYQPNNNFTPVGYISRDHYTSNNKYWSGNFLNWVTMTHADFIRKTFTGGKRSIDANKKTILQRAKIDERNAFRKTYRGADLTRLVPAAYADPSLLFYNSETSLTILDKNGRELSPEFKVRISVCDPAMPESNCTPYQNVGALKPEGLVQRYYRHLNFGLMSHTDAQATEGGVLRVPLGPVDAEFSQHSGQLASGEGVINIINDLNAERGWNPTAEKYYEALRYLKGNESGQESFCGTDGMSAEKGFNVYGCAPKRLWVDPISDPCQKTIIIVVSDEYPSKDSNMLPGSAFNPGYFDTPMNFGVNNPYNPDVSALVNTVGDAEGLSGSNRIIGNVLGLETDRCSLKFIPTLSEANGLCPSEPQAEGSFYLAGLAHNAFTGDLRPDLEGRQHVTTHVLAYRASPAGYHAPQPQMSPMWLAAKYGNFTDHNYNGIPDSDNEWMKSAELCTLYPDSIGCLPTGLSYADQGIDIEKAIAGSLIQDIGGDGICDNVGDSDHDGIIDQDDICPFDPLNDVDNDRICGDIDNCPEIANAGQADANNDGIGDVCTPPTL